ncbi:DUF2255 family protein [Reyranella sp.]|jgi:hypothetical protein|uniref:DUF2255 family protein n=1 Tax=Reyranella sp. TaxID=1929291 RepID=UPI002F95D838
MTKFDTDTLHELRDRREVAIRTGRHPESAVTIWVVVADDEVYVRSWLGARGRWYRDLASGGPATLEVGDRQLAVQAIPVGDSAAVARVSREFLGKYQPSSHAQEMVGPETLPTTLRLDPR